MMSFLLPATTVFLIIIGAFCLFVAMENDRRFRETFDKRDITPNNRFAAAGRQVIYARENNLQSDRVE